MRDGELQAPWVVKTGGDVGVMGTQRRWAAGTVREVRCRREEGLQVWWVLREGRLQAPWVVKEVGCRQEGGLQVWWALRERWLQAACMLKNREPVGVMDTERRWAAGTVGGWVQAVRGAAGAVDVEGRGAEGTLGDEKSGGCRCNGYYKKRGCRLRAC